jgi:biotin transport system substrate-specific component
MLPPYNDYKEILLLNVRTMTHSALMAALLVVCGWIAIPIPPVSFTLQTFGVLTALGVLGGKWGSMSVILYLAMGLVGLPVFSGFQGGAAVLLGPTGGFLWGFLLGGLGYWLAERLGKLPAMILFLLIAYSCGAAWFLIYAPGSGFWAAVTVCVLPYLLPEAVKLLLANMLVKRIRRNI